MVSSELGACEWFVWDLRRSGLIDRGQLDQVIGEFLKRNPRCEPPALAEYLVGQNVLSPFQAERILSGKTQGLVLGPYVLVDSAGSGSMGQVYKASSKTDNQWYAVKVLPRRSMWNVRLARRQVRSFSQFSHPGVVPFVDVGTSGGLHYLVWPYVTGETLEAKVSREGKLKPEVVAKIGLQLAQALTVCHQNGIFHGLIKPSNVMIGNDGQAKLLDFGIGSLLAENEGESLVDTMSTANTLTSGLDCSSPESIMEPTNRTLAGDQYSLGCTLYYAFAGQYPFPDGTAVEKMMAHQFKQPQSLRELVPGIPEGLVEIVERLMQKQPEARFSGSDEIVDSLQVHVVDSMAFPTMPPSGGSHFGGSSPAGSRGSFKLPEAPPSPIRAVTPLPGSLPRSQAPTTAASVGNTPPHPMPARQTIPPASAPKSPPVSPAQAASASAGRPLLPTRRTLSTPEIAFDDAPAAAAQAPAPVNPAPRQIPTRMPANATTPGWVPEARSKSSWGAILIAVVGVLVTLAVYFLGKNFLFTNS